MANPPPSPFDERRAHPRIDLLVQVQVSKADEVHILSTVNLSSGGTFLSARPATLPHFRLGLETEILIFTPESVEGDVKVRARLARIEHRARPGQPSGFAFEFVEIDELNRGRLEGLLLRVTR